MGWSGVLVDSGGMGGVYVLTVHVWGLVGWGGVV